MHLDAGAVELVLDRRSTGHLEGGDLVLVVSVFLRSVRATVVPAVATVVALLVIVFVVPPLILLS